MKSLHQVLVVISIAILHHVASKVAVLFPVPGPSHIRYHTNIARAVVKLGHEAWVCIPHYLANTSKIDTSGIKVLWYGEKLGDIEKRIMSRTRLTDEFWENSTTSALIKIGPILKHVDDLMWEVLAEGLADKVKPLKADLFILDGLPFTRFIYTVPYKLGVPYAVVGTVHAVMDYRIPFSPVATPNQLSSSNDRADDFLTRIQNFLSSMILLSVPFLSSGDPVATFAPEKPHKSVNDLLANAEVYIIELDPILDYPRPTIPNVKLIGGTAIKEAKPLKEPFKSFMDKSNKGVILITFGSMLLAIPDYIFNKIKIACEQSGLNVVWRSDNDSPNPERFLTSKWVPQNDILGHKNTKLFISHCGKNGQYEALYHGVPILCLPVFGDQPYNAERISTKGYGMKDDMRFVTIPELSAKVKELVTNSSYKNNMAKASRLFRQMYKSPMNESAYWLDHVMEYGGDYMRSSTQQIPYYQFLMLDIIALILFITWTSGMLTMYVLIKLCQRRNRSPPKKKNKSE